MPTDLRAYTCGYTRHDVAQLVAGHPHEHRTFPATVFVHTAGDRRVLFDTGYAPQPWDTGLAGRLYQRLLPPELAPEQDIAAQLDPATITHVVLSHLHPDHIGGLRHFRHARLVLHTGQLATLARPQLREGLLTGLLPDWFTAATRDPNRCTAVEEFTPGPFGLDTYDLFDDGSYQLVDLPGHARGHVGALIEGRILLAGDAAWGRDLLPQVQRMRTVPRWITHDGAAHLATSRRLLEAERGRARLLFSHDHHPSEVNLL